MRAIHACGFLIALALVAAPLNYGSGGRRAWPAAALCCAAGLAAAARLVVTRERARAAGWPAALLAGLAALGAAQALTVSPDPARTALHAANWIAYAGIAWAVAVSGRRHRDARALLTFLFAAAVVESCFGVVGELARWPDVAGVKATPGRGAVGTFHDRNHFAACAVVGLLAGLALLTDRVARRGLGSSLTLAERARATLASSELDRRVVLLVGTSACGVAVVMSASRGGYASAALGVGVLVGLGLRTWRSRALAAGLVLATVAGVAACAAAMGARALSERFAFGGFDRLVLWRAALQTGARHPIAGQGLGTLEAGPKDARYAHNEWLEAFAGGGVIGAALLAGAVGGALWVALKRWRRRPHPLLCGVVAILVAGAAHATVDYPWQTLGTGAWYFAILGLAMSPAFRAAGAIGVSRASA